MTTKKIALLFFCFLFSLSITAQDLPLQSGKQYTIGDIKVTGTSIYNEQTVIAYTGLKRGEEIYIPGDRISKVIKKLWDLDLFSDINLYYTLEGDTAFLELEIQELPELAEVKVTGLKRKSQREELIKENDLTPGKKVTENLLTTTKNYIQNKYRKDGYLNTKVVINTIPVEDTLPTNRVNMVVKVDRGEPVKVEDIDFVGNEQLSEKQLRGAMKNTKEKNFFRFWKKSKFIPSDFREDKERIIDKYKERGFRDARIVSDTLKKVDDKNVAITMQVEEGNRYYFGNIRFLGNSVYTDKQLQSVLGLKKGDVYNGVLLEEQIANRENPDANDLTNLYQNSGYLFSTIDPVEVRVYNDTIDFEIRIREGKVAYFDHITVTGNDRTNDQVIYRELHTKPGERYSKEKVMRSLRELGQLNFFDPQALNPEFKDVNPNDGTVDIEYSVVEKGASQIELQGGYGGGGFVGTLGLSFNNFSLKNIFNKDAYQPLPMGDGQRLSLRAQASIYYSSYSFSFMEPWLGGKKPFSLTTSFSHTEQYFFNSRTRNADRSRKFLITGVNVGIAQRLTVPDNYFVLSQSLGFQHYDLQNYNTGLFSFGDGYANNFTYTIGLSRDNTRIDPIFPTGGSQFNISAKVTPPYSLFNDVDYGDLQNRPEFQLRNEAGDLINASGNLLQPGEAPVGDRSKIDQEKFKWLEFYKVKFNGTWYTNIFDKFVVRTHAEYGFLGAYNNERGIPPFERFFLGGDGLGTYSLDGREAIQLRGYPNQSLVPLDRTSLSAATNDDGATIYNKYSLELRYPITLKPQASIFALTFLEGGASYDSFRDFNPFLLNRSAGLGVRVFMPQFGLLGIDFGYGFDPIPGQTNPNGWETHFIIGQQF